MATAKGGKTAKRASAPKKAAASKKTAAAKKTAPKKTAAAKKTAPKRRAAAKKTAAAKGTSILDHLTLYVSDYERSRAFYLAALAPLGIGLVMEFGKAGGFGVGAKPAFWIGEGPASFWSPANRVGASPAHVALLASDRAAVDAFHAAAIAAGAVDHGAPGVRPEYHAGYYGAFVLDPDGHNIEAVHHTFG